MTKKQLHLNTFEWFCCLYLDSDAPPTVIKGDAQDCLVAVTTELHFKSQALEEQSYS